MNWNEAKSLVVQIASLCRLTTAEILDMQEVLINWESKGYDSITDVLESLLWSPICQRDFPYGYASSMVEDAVDECISKLKFEDVKSR